MHWLRVTAYIETAMRQHQLARPGEWHGRVGHGWLLGMDMGKDGTVLVLCVLCVLCACSISIGCSAVWAETFGSWQTMLSDDDAWPRRRRGAPAGCEDVRGERPGTRLRKQRRPVAVGWQVAKSMGTDDRAARHQNSSHQDGHHAIRTRGAQQSPNDEPQ